VFGDRIVTDALEGSAAQQPSQACQRGSVLVCAGAAQGAKDNSAHMIVLIECRIRVRRE
jgi:hypothetical protein